MNTQPHKIAQNVETQNQKEARTAKCFLITCMDFRLIDDAVRFMDMKGYNNNYDQFILAGSSLGFTQDKFPHWSQTLMDHLGIGIALHEPREVMFIDHVDCGAYKKFYPDLLKNMKDEKKYHCKHMQMARDKMLEHYPQFKFRGFLMDLDGNCEEIGIKDYEVKCLEEDLSQERKFLANLKEGKQ